MTDRSGANADVIDDGINGFLVENEQAWVDAVTRLLTDDEYRAQQGLAGRVKFEKSYELKSQSEKAAQLLLSLKGS